MTGDISAKQPVNCACGAPATIAHRPELSGRAKWVVSCTRTGCHKVKRVYARTEGSAIKTWAREVSFAGGPRFVDEDEHKEPGCKLCGLHGEHVCLTSIQGAAWDSPNGRGSDEFGPHAEKWTDKKPRKWRVLHRVPRSRAA